MTRRRLLPLASLALASTLWLGAPALRAQEPAHHEAQAAEPHPTPAAEPHGEASAEHEAASHEGAPHAAEGHGQGHHGPEIKLFGRTLGPFGQFMVKLLNFGVFFFGLFFLLRGALRSAFRARAQELRDQLSQAERDQAQGQAQIRELEAKMAGLQKELDAIMVTAAADAEAEKGRILEAARQEADQILAQTLQEIEFQKRLAQQELRALVADLAVEGAEARLKAKVQGGTAVAVLDRSIEQVGGAK